MHESINVTTRYGETADIPSLFLPDESADTYGDIMRHFRLNPPRVCMETASYRIATAGAFIHRKIETNTFLFAFRNPSGFAAEKPYAVQKKLSDMNLWRISLN